MSCTMTVNGPCLRTLRFEIERAELDAAVDQRVDELMRTAKLPGFRPGKVPRDVVRRKFGKELAEEARRSAMAQAFDAGVKEHELSPVGDPQMNLEALTDEEAGPFTFELSIEVAPEFELASFDEIPVSVVLPSVAPAMIDAEVERFRQQSATLEEAEPGLLVGEDSVLTTTIVYSVDGTELEPRDERPVLVKHGLVDGMTIEGADKAFIGKAVGSELELESELPAHFDPKELAGRPATMRISIDAHRLLSVPPLDEELLERVGVASVEELRTRIEQGLEGQRMQFRAQQVDRAVEQWLLEKHELELPEQLLAKATDRRVHELAHRMMESDGLSSEEGHHKAEAERGNIAEGVRRSLSLSFVMSRIAREQGLGANAEEVQQEVAALAQSQQADPQALFEEARREGWIADVAAQVTEQKARAWLRERANVTETEPEPEPPPAEQD